MVVNRRVVSARFFNRFANALIMVPYISALQHPKKRFHLGMNMCALEVILHLFAASGKLN